MKSTVRLQALFYVMIFLGVIAVRVGGAETVDRIVAVINDDIVSLSELNNLLEPYTGQIRARNYPPEQERKMLFRVREDILNQLIDQKLTDQEIKKANISIAEKEIDSFIERVKEARLATDEELREALKAQGLSMEAYRKRIREQILRTRLVNLEVKSKIVITQEDVKAYYDQHPEVYGGEKTYHLRNIILRIPPRTDEDGRRLVYRKMETILEEFKKGETFEVLASAYSESPMAAQGGDLGTFPMSGLSPLIQEAISGLKPGEATGILDTDQGYQVFYLQEIVQASGRPLQEVAGEIREKLFSEIVDKKFKEWLESLRKRSHIKVIK